MKMIYRETTGEGVNPALTVRVGDKLLEHKTVEADSEMLDGWYSHEDIINSKKEKPKTTRKPKRAHKEDGKFKADDKSTPDVNEAYEGGKGL